MRRMRVRHNVFVSYYQPLPHYADHEQIWKVIVWDDWKRSAIETLKAVKHKDYSKKKEPYVHWHWI